jgi:hypothetical protein
MQKRNRFLIIAIPLAIVLFALLAYDYGYLRVRADVAALEEAAVEKERLLQKYLALIAAGPRIGQNLAVLKEAMKSEKAKTIEGETPSIAAASLQNTAKEVIMLRGGTITSERIEKPEELGKFKIITVAIDALLPDIRALSEILYAIETQTPYVIVRELDTTVRVYQAPRELAIKLKLSALTGGR